MKFIAAFFTAILSVAVAGSVASAQTSQDPPHLRPRNGIVVEAPPNPAPPRLLMVVAGTKIPLTLKQGISSKSARLGDPVYAQTAFPITQGDHIVIPAGTFVQGEVRRVLRPGRVKGRAEMQLAFTSMIFPNGYTVMLGGGVQGTPGADNMAMKGTEGTIQSDGGKGKDAGTIVGTAMPGAGIGAIAAGAKGAAVGGLAGGALGLATVLFTRGPEIQLATGDSVEMVLQSSLELDAAKVHRPASE